MLRLLPRRTATNRIRLFRIYRATSTVASLTSEGRLTTRGQPGPSSTVFYGIQQTLGLRKLAPDFAAINRVTDPKPTLFSTTQHSYTNALLCNMIPRSSAGLLWTTVLSSFAAPGNITSATLTLTCPATGSLSLPVSVG